MSATFLMSYPGPGWRIRGGENFRSLTKSPTNPRAALKEWLKLADAITRAGGRILPISPPVIDPPLTGMIYTANAGALFGAAETFMLSKMSVAHRQTEHEYVRQFMTKLSISSVVDCENTWEGQADICTLSPHQFLLTWGVRSVKESLAEVRARLPREASVLEVQLRDPYFHGDTCLDPLVTPNGRVVLLAHEGALVDRSLGDLRKFAGDRIEVLAVDQADALGYACNALSVNGTILAPTGLSSRLVGQLSAFGFRIEELALTELFGKGGGGPRCLVNELRGFTIPDGARDYAARRDMLHALTASYPETV